MEIKPKRVAFRINHSESVYFWFFCFIILMYKVALFIKICYCVILFLIRLCGAKVLLLKYIIEVMCYESRALHCNE